MNTLEWVRGMVRLYAHHPAHSACWESPSHPMISYVGESWCIWMSGASPQLCRTLSERPLSLLLCSRVWSCDLHDQREGRRLGEKQKEISEDIKQMWIQLYVSESITKPTHVPKRTLSLWIPPTGSMGIPSILCTSTNTTPNYLSSLLCKLPTEVRMSFGKLLLNVWRKLTSICGPGRDPNLRFSSPLGKAKGRVSVPRLLHCKM